MAWDAVQHSQATVVPSVGCRARLARPQALPEALGVEEGGVCLLVPLEPRPVSAGHPSEAHGEGPE